MGIKNLENFETITTPEANTIARALENLYFLEILDVDCKLTELGIKACDIPIDPRLAVVLLRAGEKKFKCTYEVLIIASMISVQNLFYQVKDPAHLLKAKQKIGIIEGDHLTLLNIYREYNYSKDKDLVS